MPKERSLNVKAESDLRKNLKEQLCSKDYTSTTDVMALPAETFTLDG